MPNLNLIDYIGWPANHPWTVQGHQQYRSRDSLSTKSHPAALLSLHFISSLIWAYVILNVKSLLLTLLLFCARNITLTTIPHCDAFVTRCLVLSYSSSMLSFQLVSCCYAPTPVQESDLLSQTG
jgi:membrane protease YdiL (CAAX protease family)